MQDPGKNLSREHGPFDIIGDIHGCCDETVELLTRLGYHIPNSGEGRVQPPAGRKAVFLGDLVGRGPKIPQVLRLVMGMVADHSALCVPGNHDIKLVRKLQGKPVEVKRGLAESLAQLEECSAEFRRQVVAFFDNLPDHYLLDNRRLVVVHAGMPEQLQGEASMEAREFALFGKKTGEIDEFGYPIRFNWAEEYHGPAMVVYGHTPQLKPRWVNNTINIDTGCIFGGKLTALRYPEKELVSVPARSIYWPGKPLFTK